MVPPADIRLSSGQCQSMSVSTVVNSVMNGSLSVCVCVLVSFQEEGRNHAHAQPVHTAGREADDAHQHRFYHHLQHSV